MKAIRKEVHSEDLKDVACKLLGTILVDIGSRGMVGEATFPGNKLSER